MSRCREVKRTRRMGVRRKVRPEVKIRVNIPRLGVLRLAGTRRHKTARLHAAAPGRVKIRPGVHRLVARPSYQMGRIR